MPTVMYACSLPSAVSNSDVCLHLYLHADCPVQSARGMYAQSRYLGTSEIAWQGINLCQVLLYLIGVHTANHAPCKILS